MAPGASEPTPLDRSPYNACILCVQHSWDVVRGVSAWGGGGWGGGATGRGAALSTAVMAALNTGLLRCGCRVTAAAAASACLARCGSFSQILHPRL